MSLILLASLLGFIFDEDYDDLDYLDDVYVPIEDDVHQQLLEYSLDEYDELWKKLAKK